MEEGDPARLSFEQMWRAWIDLRSFAVAGANAALYRSPPPRLAQTQKRLWKIRQRGLARCRPWCAARVGCRGAVDERD